MKLVLFSKDNDRTMPGILGVHGVHPIGENLLAEAHESDAMRLVIDRFEVLRPKLQALLDSGTAIPLTAVRLHAPLPRPNKILSALGNRLRGVGEPPKDPHLFLKGGAAMADPGVVVELPNLGGRELFIADAALGLVIKGPARKVAASDWQSVVFGYTAVIDIAARTNTLVRWSPGTCVGAACDAFAPIGPVIVTADEMPDLDTLRIQLSNNGELWQDYALSSMFWQPADLVALGTLVMTLHSGDVIVCGGDPAGQGPIQIGDNVEASIAGIGALPIRVADPLNRHPDRSIRLGQGMERDTSREVLFNRTEIMRQNAL